MRKVRVVVAIAFQDAGDATRAIEIARSVRNLKPKVVDLEIIFLSHGSRFEKRVLDLGFGVFRVKPKMKGVGLYEDLGMTPENFVGSEELAKKMIKGEIEAYRKLRPDVVLYGFWPFAGVARRMMDKEIPGVCFVPLPLVDNFFDVLPDVPEQVRILSVFPKRIRLAIIHLLPRFVKRRIPVIRQTRIRRAAKDLEWKEKAVNVFDLLKPDLMLVNDLEDYYSDGDFPDWVKFTGPLFSVANNDDEVDGEIMKIFSKKNKRVKVFCSLSSSGSGDMLREALKVFAKGEGLNWDAVILAPHFSVSEAYEILGKRKGVYVTNKFIPAQKVNAMADVVICHGGQGTLQTAIWSGTPLVGFAAQQEQFINLANIEAAGAGVRISKKDWNAERIREEVGRVVSDDNYRKNAGKLGKRMREVDGKKNSGLEIWEFIEKVLK